MRLLVLLLFAAGCASQAQPLPESDALFAAVPEAASAAPCDDCIATFPSVLADTTRDAEGSIDRYGCKPGSNQSGPERRYELDLDEPGLLIATLDVVEEGADVDVHILGAADDDCLARGDVSAVSFVEAGVHSVVVDSWVDRNGVARAGDYALTVQFVGVSDYAEQGLGAEVFGRALRAWANAHDRGETARRELSVVDFALRSDKKRFWTVDLQTGELLFALHTSHGSASATDDDWRVAETFSNVSGSHQSSLGLMRTAEDYWGTWGHSMRLDGLEPHNSLVRKRTIVLHPSEWATPEFRAEYGGVGPSWGCIMLDPERSDEVIAKLKGGSLIWSDFAGDADMDGSAYLGEN